MAERYHDLPPGSTSYFDTVTDAYGNELYTGSFYVPPWSETPVAPTYATAPVPIKTEPPVPGPPGSRVIPATVVEGVRTQAGDIQTYSTGVVRPANAVGWVNPQGAIVLDGSNAFAAGSLSGVSDTLELSGFAFDIPAGAEIVGLRVRVYRSKI